MPLGAPVPLHPVDPRRAGRVGTTAQSREELEVEIADRGAIEPAPRPKHPRTSYGHAVLTVQVDVPVRLARAVAELLEDQRGVRIALPIDEPPPRWVTTPVPT